MKFKLIKGKNNKQVIDEINEFKCKIAELRQAPINEVSSFLYQLYDEQLKRKLEEYINCEWQKM